MERIVVNSSKPIQLHLPEGSTVFVLNTRPQEPSEKPAYSFPDERSVKPETVLALLQDYLNYGPEDIDINGKQSSMFRALREVRNANISAFDASRDINDTLDESRLEGRKIGSESKRLQGFKRFLTVMVEEVYTEPQHKTA